MQNNKWNLLLTLKVYASILKKEGSKIENISEKLLESDFYNPVALNDILPRNVAHHYTFLKTL